MAESEEDHISDLPAPLPLWQEIQKRTFTNWVNLRLSPSFINDLVCSLSLNIFLKKQYFMLPFFVFSLLT